QAGDGDAALRAYLLAIRDNPHEGFYQASLGQTRAFTALQRPQQASLFAPKAVENYRRGAELEPGNPYHAERAYQFHDGLAQIGIDADANRRQAEEWWQVAISLDPRDPDLWIDGGVLQLHAARPGLALPRFEEALALKPTAPRALTGAGGARVLLGDRTGAVDAYRQALDLDPSDTEAQQRLQAAQALPA